MYQNTENEKFCWHILFEYKMSFQHQIQGRQQFHNYTQYIGLLLILPFTGDALY